MAKHKHFHWHPGVAHDEMHEHTEDIPRGEWRNHHAAAPFGKAPKVTHIGEDLTKPLMLSIEKVKKEKAK